MLLNKSIIVGICGGIASYKTVELVSQLQQAGALVDVIMTEHAEDFVRPLTFSTMSHRPVYSDLWEASGQAAEHHIALAQTAEVVAIVPATANTLAKLAHGSVDNMLTAVALATQAPLLLAPAMYSQMYMHPATQANLALLRERGATIVEPEVGRLASGAIGPGRLPDTPVLLGAIRLLLGRHGDLAGYHAVITAGGTHEPIDPVRYIGNRSSGKMGYALAEEARDRGAHVTLISGPVALPPPYGVTLHKVETALQMRDAVYAAVAHADVLIMSAAVADFRPAELASQKLKKASLGQAGGQVGPERAADAEQHGTFPLYLTHNPDILGELGERGELERSGVLDAFSAPDALAAPLDKQQSRKQGARRLIRVGFAAETENLLANARAKLQAKRLDLLVANDVGRSDSGFGTDTNKVSIFSATGEVEDLAVMSKTEVAAAIWNRVVPLLGR